MVILVKVLASEVNTGYHDFFNGHVTEVNGQKVKNLRHLIELVEAKGVQLCSITDNIDTKTASGRMMINVLGSVVQWQREQIAERTKEVLDHKKSRGERVSRFAPYGFRFNTQQ